MSIARHAAATIVIVALLSGCAADAPPPASPGASSTEGQSALDISSIESMSPDQKRAAIAENFPIEVPVPVGEVNRAQAQGEDAWDYEIVVDAEPAALAAWYRAAMEGRNWKMTGEQVLPLKGSALSFSKGAAESRVSITAEGESAKAVVVLGIGVPVLESQ